MAECPTTEATWTQLSDSLFRFIRRRVSDDYVAEDLLQEVFLRIHRNIHALVEADRLAGWVYQIARNVVYDHYRQKPNAAVPLPNADLLIAEADVDNHKQQRCLNEASGWLDELIAKLPSKYHEAVKLAEIDGLTQQQVADRLGISLSGAKSRVQRGRAMLKNLLDQCCTFEFDRLGNLLDYQPRPDRTVCHGCDHHN